MKTDKIANEKKSCCENKDILRYSSNCLCIIKEVTKEPAELSHSFSVNNNHKIFSDVHFGEIVQVKNLKSYSNSFISTFHSPPNEDINLLKCVLRI